MSVYSVDWCISLFLHPSTHRSLCHSSSHLLLRLPCRSIRPSLTQSQLDTACMLLACYYCSSFMCGWVCAHGVCVSWHRNTSVSLSDSPRHHPQRSNFKPPTRPEARDEKKMAQHRLTFYCPPFLCLPFFPHAVPAEPCPGQRGAVPTMSPASYHRGRGQGPGLPPPTLCSPPPARPTGQLRGWCGCRQRSTASR